MLNSHHLTGKVNIEQTNQDGNGESNRVIIIVVVFIQSWKRNKLVTIVNPKWAPVQLYHGKTNYIRIRWW